ncbi:hypothetical protein C0995_005806 [Termitomyces sp. Mi166|nr:hypothetical protein C0995_005806 [Termitomyces sp. Mi166\
MSTAKPAKKEDSGSKDPFIVRHFRLTDTEESGMLIINQATEIPARNLRSDDNTGNEDNEDNKGEDDGDDNGDGGDDDDSGAMDVDTSGLVEDAKFLELLHLEEAL